LESITVSVKNGEAYQIVWLIRRLFRALGQKSNERLQPFGISAADRAVLEFLYPDEALSVPEIAARYQVSRQHVQVTVNSLIDGRLLTANDNPRHKRSPLIALTAKGRKLFTSIREQDDEIVDRIFAAISTEDRRTTQKTLESLLAQLR
jgi:DNA-binding MarR family transcriptional regulator